MAELPDKSMIATIVMGTRWRPLLVFLGASAAFVVHVGIAVVAGHLISLLPHKVIQVAVAVAFLVGAAFLLFVPERHEEERARAEVAAEAGRFASAKVVAAAFGVILVGELGDLTQLLTLNLAARYHQGLSVFIGAAAALVALAAVGAYGGRALLAVLPLGVLRRVAGVVLLGVGAYSIYALASS